MTFLFRHILIGLFVLLFLSSLNAQNPDTLSAKTIADSLSLPDSAKVVVYDTLRLLYHPAIDKEAFLLNKTEVDFLNYRGFSDVVSYFPASTQLSPSLSVDQDYLSLYGTGVGELAVLVNGIPTSSRFLRSNNFNLTSAENMQSIEIVPLPRGFLYNNIGGFTALNVRMRDRVSAVPITRIKYFEGYGGEGFLDVQYTGLHYKRFAISVDVQNRKIDEGYDNSENGMWLASFGVKYLLSNKLQILLRHTLTSYDNALNGGVDSVATVTRFPTAAFNDLLYDEVSSVVHFSDRYQKISGGRTEFTLLGNVLPWGTSTINAYYSSQSKEFRQNETAGETDSTLVQKIANRSEFTYGVMGTQEIDFAAFTLKAGVLLENSRLTTLNEGALEYNYFSAYGIASLPAFGEYFVPSFFGKYTQYKGFGLSGLGGDVTATFSHSTKVYVGFSSFNGFNPLTAEGNSDFKTAVELGIKGVVGNTRYSGNLFLTETPESYLSEQSSVVSFSGVPSVTPAVVLYKTRDKSSAGVSFAFEHSYEFLRFQLNGRYLATPLRVGDSNAEPQIIVNPAVYFQDILFDSALVLKTGFDFRYASSHADMYWDVLNEKYFYPVGKAEIGDSYRLNFTLAGEIAQSAIIYFVWENLINNRYYDFSFYPNKPRNIRFGIAWQLTD